jgi:hypothetical protein
MTSLGFTDELYSLRVNWSAKVQRCLVPAALRASAPGYAGHYVA